MVHQIANWQDQCLSAAAMAAVRKGVMPCECGAHDLADRLACSRQQAAESRTQTPTGSQLPQPCSTQPRTAPQPSPTTAATCTCALATSPGLALCRLKVTLAARGQTHVCEPLLCMDPCGPKIWRMVWFAIIDPSVIED